jgi:predicted RNase H-like nuclease (RuvC/YqgF family)
MNEKIENPNETIEALESEIAYLKSENEALESENADLKKKLEQASASVKYHSDVNAKFHADVERINRILDNLKPVSPRSEEKTEDNQWPVQYDLVTRLSIWLGNK